jgi:hypothetical protein
MSGNGYFAKTGATNAVIVSDSKTMIDAGARSERFWHGDCFGARRCGAASIGQEQKKAGTAVRETVGSGQARAEAKGRMELQPPEAVCLPMIDVISGRA